MESNDILRRDSAVESLNEHYRNQFFEYDSDDSVSECGTAPSVTMGTPYAGTARRDETSENVLSTPSEALDIDNFYIEVINKSEFMDSRFSIATMVAMIILIFSTVGTAYTLKNLDLSDIRKAIFESMFHRSSFSFNGRKKRMLQHLPRSFSSFAPVSNHLEKNFIPLFLNLPGTEADLIFTALKECLNLKEQKILQKKESKSEKVSDTPDFITTDSLCNFTQNVQLNEKAQIFMMIRNPITRSAVSFKEMQTYKSDIYNEDLVGYDFNSFAGTTLVKDNFLTRSITCKQHGTITETDYEVAEFFMKHFITYGDYDHLEVFASKILKGFNSNFQPHQHQCFTDVITRGTRNNPHHKDVGATMVENFDILKRINEFDERLYTFVKSSTLH